MLRATHHFLDDYRDERISDTEVPEILASYTYEVVAEIADEIGVGGTSKGEQIDGITRSLPEWRRHGKGVGAPAPKLPTAKSAAGPAVDDPATPADGSNGNGANGNGSPDGGSTPVHTVALAAKEPRDPITGDLLSNVIRARSRAISFEKYREAIDKVVCKDCNPHEDGVAGSAVYRHPDRYEGKCRHDCREFAGERLFERIKKATFQFLRCECDLQSLIEGSRRGEAIPAPDGSVTEPDPGVEGFTPEQLAHSIYHNGVVEDGALRYWESITQQLLGRGLPDEYFSPQNCDGVIEAVARGDCVIELIWSYWYEEAMLVQTMQAIAYRFQNRRRGERDPLASLEIDPLRPLNNIIWGYVQDERDQLSVARRAHEYDHHYGLRLKGRAVGNFNPIDSRDRFLGAFHHLLHLATVFYKEENDKTYEADGFPILTALQELHVILAEAAHNQYGDLPSQARGEMLIMQWILNRPEMREFLPGRASVPYRESWMGRVEAMRSLQGWSGASINHFSILAEFGERLLLSVRLRNWMDITNPIAGANWATFWRTEIQQYVNSYRAVTGVDLAAEATTPDQLKLRRTLPSELLARAV